MRLVQTACLTAALGGGTACSAMLGYDSAEFDGGVGGDPKSTDMDPKCIPGPGAVAPASTCGAFVSAAKGDDTSGKGSPGNPFRTLARALAESKVVYACNDAALDEAVAINGEVSIFGGLDCEQGWAYAPGKRTDWHAPSDQVPIVLRQEAKLTLRDVAVAAGDAAAPGGSSIAVIASPQSVLDAQRCSFASGAGRDGAEPPPAAGAAKDGVAGHPGNQGCSGGSSATEPGLGGQAECDGADVSGGSGGPGFATSSGADGSDGLPSDGAGEDGHGGKKEDAAACSAGSAGAPGDTGAGGAGAKGLGALSHDGFAGMDGVDGAPGKPGHGAGGGGGARACVNFKAGPSGGGGGSGGCGGPGGRGGRAGGASIGIASLNATLVLSEVLITAGRGGHGSDGGEGGPGGKGGLGGAQGAGDLQAKACAGGKGGDGGFGGRGGGGRGGHSIGIAHLGALPPPSGVEITVSVPGAGGHGDGPEGDAAAGVAEKVQAIE